MASFRQASGSLTADDCADWRLRISAPISSHGSSSVHWRSKTRSSKHFDTLECFQKSDPGPLGGKDYRVMTHRVAVPSAVEERVPEMRQS
jgi:hypothetical protein